MAKPDSLRRHKPRREPLPRILIVCEGERTEKGYFNHLRVSRRIPIELEIEAGGTPKRLVEQASKMKKQAAKEAERDRDENLSFDEVWCVFDVDEHPLVADAKQQARDNGIALAISNPCFELWVLLHFQDQRRHIERGGVQKLCRKYLPGYDKVLPCDDLIPHYGDALKRAVDLDKWQASRNNSGANPSTGVYQLTERVKSYRK